MELMSTKEILTFYFNERAAYIFSDGLKKKNLYMTRLGPEMLTVPITILEIRLRNGRAHLYPRVR